MSSLSIKELLEKDEDALNMLLKNQNLPQIYKQKLLYEALSKKKSITPEALAINFLKQRKNVDSIIF
jgi:aryl-alcohol dehydrogenase-like predicted oxidoreductase